MFDPFGETICPFGETICPFKSVKQKQRENSQQNGLQKYSPQMTMAVPMVVIQRERGGKSIS